MSNPEKVAAIIAKFPKVNGPFSNDDHLVAAKVVSELLTECGIYEQRSIGLTLARITT